MRRAGLSLFVLLAVHGGLAAQEQASFTLTGRVEHPRRYTTDDLRALEPVTIMVKHDGMHGPHEARYTGALLWGLLAAAGPVDDVPGGRGFLRHTLLAQGQDGYGAVLAIGELDPSFEGKSVLVAYAEGGKPLATLRLIVPADVHAGRSVRDLASIELR